MSKSPTTQAIEVLGSRGWQVDIVERRLTSRLKRDLFGFADLLAVNENEMQPTLALQVTDETSVSKRLKKCLSEERAMRCLRAGWKIEIWGFRKKPDRLGRWLKARALVLTDDGGVRVVDDSLVAPV